MHTVEGEEMRWEGQGWGSRIIQQYSRGRISLLCRYLLLLLPQLASRLLPRHGSPACIDEAPGDGVADPDGVEGSR
jgi:hypothetical protein